MSDDPGQNNEEQAAPMRLSEIFLPLGGTLLAMADVPQPSNNNDSPNTVIHVHKDDALIMLAEAGNLADVQKMIADGADAQYRDSEAFRVAVLAGHVDVARELIDAGADFNAMGGEALLHTAMSGSGEMARMLIESGANVFEGGGMPLRFAVRHENVDVVRELLRENVDAGINGANTEALTIAAISGNVEIAELLRADGGDLDKAGVLGAAAYHNHGGMIQWALDNGADIHAENDVAIRNAAEAGNPEIVKMLLENGANMFANDGEALKLAQENGHTEVVQLLEAHRDSSRENGVGGPAPMIPGGG